MALFSRKKVDKGQKVTILCASSTFCRPVGKGICNIKTPRVFFLTYILTSANIFRAIFDASGRSDLLDQWIQRGQKGAEIVLAGFYSERINFAFPPAFMKEIKIRIAAEWSQSDLIAVRALVESGALSLGGLITHRSSAEEADLAYRTAFETADCIKMMLDWSDIK